MTRPSPYVTVGGTANTTYICPDMLSIRHLGGADGWRGHLVRLVFRVLWLITGV